MKELETKRLKLRKFEKTDINSVYKNWSSNKKITEFLRWPAHENIKETEELINMWLDLYKEEGFFHWAIVLKQTDEPIGSISVEMIEDNGRTVCIGYLIGQEFWNNGYATESLREIIRYFIDELKVSKVEARFDTRNAAAGKVMKNAGMKYEKTLKNDDINNQGTCDCHYYSITEEDIRNKDENR